MFFQHIRSLVSTISISIFRSPFRQYPLLLIAGHQPPSSIHLCKYMQKKTGLICTRFCVCTSTEHHSIKKVTQRYVQWVFVVVALLMCANYYYSCLFLSSSDYLQHFAPDSFNIPAKMSSRFLCFKVRFIKLKIHIIKIFSCDCNLHCQHCHIMQRAGHAPKWRVVLRIGMWFFKKPKAVRHHSLYTA